MDEMEKNYNPEFEKRIYDFWMKNKLFEAHPNPEKEPFTIVMPPPNITGQLHMGHALNQTVQDILTRFKRMDGYETLWLPGTDHASIATEVKIVDQMKKEGITKKDVGREGFLERAWQWKATYGGRIVEQLKRLGTSCDWSKEAFTMDKNLSAAVVDAFVKYYDKGLIYRGDRIINWCPCCKTALSDAEVEYTEQQSYLWHYKYPFADGSGSLTIATTRPETMLGDTAVAVNPKDERLAPLIGKMLNLPLTDRQIPVIGDEYVEIGFGTGAVKITPAHDPNDFEVGLRHNLETIKVIDDGGVMNENAGKYCGLDRAAARKQVVEDLTAGGYMVKIEPYAHNVGECYRCGTTIEPMLSKQWFVKMKPLAEPAIAAVRSKKVEFVPSRFEKVYFNWMENIKDWCISRQLWWGHRIPAYYCDECGEMVVSGKAPEKCPKCGAAMRQDEDVLDTWFSSALWPFSTLGYPRKTKELNYFYPTTVLVTAYDIIFFWVARMIFSGIEFMYEPPFGEVLIHGIVRDKLGRKMSKSLGNGVDPLEIIDKYGADALRFSLANGIAPGSDTRYSDEKLDGCRNFMNKLWNASRFVIMSKSDELKSLKNMRLNLADKWILTKLNDLIRDVSINLNRYEIGIAAAKLYDFVWSEFCDWFIEAEKPLLYSDNPQNKQHASSILCFVLGEILKLMHPFVPFITEEINSKLNPGTVLMTAEWPKFNKARTYRAEERCFEGVKEIVTAIRGMRADMNVPLGKKIKLYIKPHKDGETLKSAQVYLTKLANLSEIVFFEERSDDMGKVTAIVTEYADLLIPLGDLVDAEKEVARLNKEIAEISREIERVGQMLQNRNFVERAPQKLVDGEREKLENYKIKLAKLNEKLAIFA